jgi:hypothetical protein
MRRLSVLLTAGVLCACGQSETGARPVERSVPADTIAELPLQRGFYVMSDTSCGEASNATLMLIRRGGVNWARSACDFQAIEKAGPTSYRATVACTDIQRGEIESSTYLFEIPDATQFSYGTEDSDYRTHFRHCEQSSLPDPWRDNDISDLIGEGVGR